MEHYHEHDLEDDNVDGASPPGVGATTSSGTARWNPTKDQITMLENLYRQGIRTPSAEQIQQITARLKAYGHIEGKNVFYWFQNHKARQRQKQKQESLAYLNRFLHKPSPTVPHFTPPPPLPNVMCSPYYVPQGDMGYFQPYPKLLLTPTSGFRRKPTRSSEKLDVSRVYSSDVPSYDALRRGFDANVCPQNQSRSMVHDDQECFTMMGNSDETLPLFPLHPTGVLSSSSFGSTSENSYGVAEAANSTIASRYGQPFFDFFSGRSSS